MSNVIVLDTETSDLDPSKGGALLELAWIKLQTTEDGGWEIVASASNYIEYSGVISPHAQAVHHIKADQLTAISGAVPKTEAIQKLLSFHDQDTIFVAHNMDFDSKFLQEIPGPWICTLKCSRHLWPDAPGHSNQVLRYWLNIEPTAQIQGLYPHQALYDVATTTALLLKMLVSQTLVNLVNLTRSPVKLKRMNFGKHRGLEFNQIPTDYLRWLRGQPNLDPDLKHTLDSMLK